MFFVLKKKILDLEKFSKKNVRGILTSSRGGLFARSKKLSKPAGAPRPLGYNLTFSIAQGYLECRSSGPHFASDEKR